MFDRDRFDHFGRCGVAGSGIVGRGQPGDGRQGVGKRLSLSRQSRPSGAALERTGTQLVQVFRAALRAIEKRSLDFKKLRTAIFGLLFLPQGLSEKKSSGSSSITVSKMMR